MAAARANLADFMGRHRVATSLALSAVMIFSLQECAATPTNHKAAPVPAMHLVPNLGRVVGPAPDHQGFTLVDTCIEDANESASPYKDLAASYTVTQDAKGDQIVSKLSVVTDRNDGVTHVYVNDDAKAGPEKPAQPLDSEAGIIVAGFMRYQSGKSVKLPQTNFTREMGDAADVACSVYVPTNATLTHGGPGMEHMSDLSTGAFVEVDPQGERPVPDAAHNTFFLERYAAEGFAQANNPTPLTLAAATK